RDGARVPEAAPNDEIRARDPRTAAWPPQVSTAGDRRHPEERGGSTPGNTPPPTAGETPRLTYTLLHPRGPTRARYRHNANHVRMRPTHHQPPPTPPNPQNTRPPPPAPSHTHRSSRSSSSPTAERKCTARPPASRP